MTNPVRFRLPAGCPRCAHKNHQPPATEILGGVLVLTWRCDACGHQWSVRRREPVAHDQRASDGHPQITTTRDQRRQRH